MNEELVFKALADASRRHLLDLLFVQDGQTLSQLVEQLPMSRFGVMKHLQVLEDAGLLTTHKIGREKFHYLNPVPIQEAYERWVSKYSQPWTQSLVNLRQMLETETMTQAPAHKMQIYIRTTPERLWEALTSGHFTQQYYMGSRVESTWEPGAPYTYVAPDGSTLIAGEVRESTPPRRLVTTFNALWLPEEARGNTTLVTYEIEPVGDSCKLTMLHEGLTPDAPMTLGIQTGWAQILSSLKSLLETGQPLVIPPM